MMLNELLSAVVANKAASLGVGLSVLLGSGVAVEASGIGPSVREVVGVSQPASDEQNDGDETVLPLVEDEDLDLDLDLDADEDEGDGAGNGNGTTVSHEAAPDDMPGNLVTRFHPDGSFSLRGVLEGAYAEGDEYTISVRVASFATDDAEALNEDAELEVEVGMVVTLEIGDETAFRSLGKPSDEEYTLAEALELYAGQLVVVYGSCEGEFGAEDSECYVDRIHVLGGPADDAEGDELEADVQGAGKSGDDEHGKPADTPPSHSSGQGNAAGDDGGSDPESEDED